VQVLKQFNRLVNMLMMIVGGVAVLAQMALATGNVVMRCFQRPFSGTYELVGFFGAIIIASALGYTQTRKDHIAVDILTSRFPPKINRILDVMRYFIEMLFFGAVAWEVFVWGRKIAAYGELSETLKIIYHPFVYGVSLGFALLSLALLVDFITTLFAPGRKPS
jgi:TRAP-type C4-dicarboxylate transport system permease small subunit